MRSLDSIRRRKFLKASGVLGAAGLSGCVGGGDGGDGDGDSGDGDSSDGDSSDGGSSDGDSSGDGDSSDGDTTGSTEDELADKIVAVTGGGTYGENNYESYLEPFGEEFGVEIEHIKTDPFSLAQKMIAGTAQEFHWCDFDSRSFYEAAVEDQWAPLRTENIDNWDRIQEPFLPQNQPFHTGGGENLYHAPATYGGYGAVWREDMMDKPTSWSDLQNLEDNQLGMCAYTNSVVSTGALAAGLNFNNIPDDYEANMEQVWNEISEFNENTLEWWSQASNMTQLLANGEVAGGQSWIGRMVALREDQDVPARYTVPEEGALYWFDVRAIPADIDEKKRYTAEKLIDYSLGEEPNHQFVDRMPYGQPIEFDDEPQALQENPDVQNIDRLKIWDYEVLGEYQEDWSEEFTQTIRS